MVYGIRMEQGHLVTGSPLSPGMMTRFLVICNLIDFIALQTYQCIVIGPVCVFATGGQAGIVCLWVCYQLEIACIDLHQTGFVVKGSGHLLLIKFWPSCAPPLPRGGLRRAKMFGSALLQPARSIFASLWALFFRCRTICWSCIFNPKPLQSPI